MQPGRRGHGRLRDDVPNFLDQAWAAFNGQACSYSINPTSRNHGAEAGTGTISVTAGSGCAWTAQPLDSWIDVTAGAAGSGNGTVRYAIEANPSDKDRSGTITVAGKTFRIQQAAGGPPNQPPQADAGPDQQVYATDPVSLQGTGVDPDGDNLSFSWTQLSGPQVSFENDDSPVTGFVAPWWPRQRCCHSSFGYRTAVARPTWIRASSPLYRFR